MTLRILFTLAILAGLAAAPAAQTFRWEAGHDHGMDRMVERMAAQIEHAMERASRAVERASDRVSRQVERRAEYMASRAERQVDRVRERVESSVRRQTRLLERRSGGRSWDAGTQGRIDDNPCDNGDRWHDNDRYRHCEVRESRLPAGPLSVDAGRNGGIRVEGWDGGDVVVRAVVQTNARDEAGAKRVASQVEIRAGGGRVSANGPQADRDEGWAVSYRIRVPRRADLELNASNGGISIANVAGTIRFDTTNGGVRLSDLGGNVNGRTRNGGLSVSLGSDHWDGEGLDVETSNGGVTLEIPASYNAELETWTVNGGFRSEIPLTLTGELTPRRGISARLGAGGAPVRVRTVNGGVRLEQR